MKKIIFTCAAAFSVLIFLSTNLISQNDCNKTESFKNIQLRIFISKASGCYFKIDQEYYLLKANKNRNRSYSFFSNGRIMAFIGTDDYEFMSQSTGSRSFHLLPFKNQTAASYEPPSGDEINVKLPSGYKAVFSSEKGDIVSIEGFKVNLQPIEHFDIMVKKGGGIDIKPEKGNIVIDYGWRTGGMSISQLYRSSVIYDAEGNTCQVKNSELYIVDPKDTDEVIFKIKNNSELDIFLKKRCPMIKMVLK
jgi:hypothetical protein